MLEFFRRRNEDYSKADSSRPPNGIQTAESESRDCNDYGAVDLSRLSFKLTDTGAKDDVLSEHHAQTRFEPAPTMTSIATKQFAENAKPLVLEAKRAGLPSVLFIGGFGGNAFHWRELAKEANDQIGVRAEVFGLKGQDGTREGMLSVSHIDWELDIKRRIEEAIERDRKPPIICAASTGGMAVVDLLNSSAGSELDILGLAIVGPPFKFSNPVFEHVLPLLNRLTDDYPALDRFFQNRNYPPTALHRLSEMLARWRGEPVNDNVINPRPFPALFEMQTLKDKAWFGLAEANYPVLFLHGDKDRYVNKPQADAAFRQVGSEQKRIEYFDAPHLVSLSENPTERARFLELMKAWICEVGDIEPAGLS